MPTIIFYKCATCSTRLGAHDEYQSIGEPLLICPKCGGINVIANNRNEWELTTHWGQIRFRGKVVFFSLILGFGTALLLWELFKRFFHLYLPFLLYMPLGVWVWYYLLSKNMNSSIRASQKRMADPAYRSLLTQLGLRRDP